MAPEPWKFDLVPEDTTTSPSVRPVTTSEAVRLMSNGFTLVDRGMSEWTVMVGLVVS